MVLCWRCSKVRVRVWGVPCPECKKILDAEYDAKVAANGGKLLYLDSKELPNMGQYSKICTKCEQPFEYELRRGRHPTVCPECKGESTQFDATPKPTDSSNEIPTPAEIPTRTAVVEVPLVAMPVPRPAIDLSAFVTQLREELDQHMRAAGVRSRLLEALDEYFADVAR